MKKSSVKSRKFSTYAIVAAIFFVTIIALRIFMNAVYVPVVMMYHSVGEKGCYYDGTKLNVYPETFARQMKFLYEHDYNVVPLHELIEMMKNGKGVPHKTLSITFDDGLKNNFTYAYPVLKKYNFPATIFVPVQFVNGLGYLTWEEINTMQDSNISIGSHTISHKWLPSFDDEELRREVFDSKEILEKMTGKEVKTFSYPMGAFDERARSMVEEAGYVGAVSTNPGPKYPSNDPYVLKRIRISMSSASMLVLWIETSGYYTFIKEVRDDD